MAKKNASSYLFLLAVVVVVILSGYAIFTRENTATPDPVDNVVVTTASEIDADKLAQALTDQGVKFYYAWWCPHCEDQIALFGNAFETLDSTDCAEGVGSGQFNQFCTDLGVTTVPAWVWPDGTVLTGARPFENLAEQAGLVLTEIQIETDGPTVEVIETE